MKEMVLGGSVLILALAALRRALRGRMDPRLGYALWILAAARLLIPGALFASPAAGLPVEFEPAALAGEAMDAVLDWGKDVPLAAYPGSQRTWTPSWVPEEELSGELRRDAHGNTTYMLTASWTGFFRFWAPIVWMGGAALMALWLVLSNWGFYMRLYAKRRRLELPADAGAGRLRVYAVRGLESPCLFGLFRPAVYVEDGDLAAGRLRHILTHEYTHYRHGDHVWALVRCACLTVHWFNPLVWWAAAMSRRDCELACDTGALDRLGEAERLSYGDTLLAVAAGNSRLSGLLHASTAMNESKRTMKERIELIVKRPRMLGITLVLVLAVAAAVTACTFGGREAEDEPPPDEASVQTDLEQTASGPDEVQAEVLELAELDRAGFTVTWYAREGAPATNTLWADFAPFLEDALSRLTWKRAGERTEPDADAWTVLWPFVFYESSDLVCWNPAAYLSGHASDDPEPPEPVWYLAPGAYDAVEAAVDAYYAGTEEMRANGQQILDLIESGADPSQWIPLLRDLRWLTAFGAGEPDETADPIMTVMDQLYYCVRGERELTDQEWLDILSANQGLDGAYSEYYQEIVWQMFRWDPDRFVALLREAMDAGERSEVLGWVKGELVMDGYAESTGDITDEEALSLLENEPLLRVYVESPLSFTQVGEVAQIRVRNLPEDDYTLTYWTGDTNVATVDDAGLVTAVGPGAATIVVRFTSPAGERELYCYAIWEDGVRAAE